MKRYIDIISLQHIKPTGFNKKKKKIYKIIWCFTEAGVEKYIYFFPLALQSEAESAYIKFLTKLPRQTILNTFIPTQSSRLSGLNYRQISGYYTNM